MWKLKAQLKLRPFKADWQDPNEQPNSCTRIRRIVGAAPAGARDEASAAAAVREMFSSIAPRYDLLNHVLSMNIDRVWWNRTARMFADVLSRPDAQVLDLVLRHRRHDVRAASAR